MAEETPLKKTTGGGAKNYGSTDTKSNREKRVSPVRRIGSASS
jgi:hypothetical protein